MKLDTPVPLHPPSLSFIFFFFFWKPLPTHISLCLIGIILPLSGQISDETWYTWWHLAMTIYSDGHNENQ